MKKFGFLLILVIFAQTGWAQNEDLLALVDTGPKKERVKNAFKSTRVIMGQSMEFLAKGTLDVRILHRFGPINSGYQNFWGLDQASMRLGFDYGITNSLGIGIGRSTFQKELDGFIKFRPIWQSTGPGAIPFSVVLVGGMTADTMPWADPTRTNFVTSKMAYYGQMIIGRKFSEGFTFQLTPTYLHRNLVPTESDPNDVYAMGFGGRIKLSKRVSFNVDYFYVYNGLTPNVNYFPLSVGFDIETGGHVFQLNFSNAIGMNERAFLMNTTNSWEKGQVLFGFNLSRVFTVVKRK
jgi:hypothetical protein